MFDAVERSYDYLVGNELCRGGRVVNRRSRIVGCGVISRTYGYTLGMFDWVDLVACADVFPERAEERAEQSGHARDARSTRCSPIPTSTRS